MLYTKAKKQLQAFRLIGASAKSDAILILKGTITSTSAVDSQESLAEQEYLKAEFVFWNSVADIESLGVESLTAMETSINANTTATFAAISDKTNVETELALLQPIANNLQMLLANVRTTPSLSSDTTWQADVDVALADKASHNVTYPEI